MAGRDVDIGWPTIMGITEHAAELDAHIRDMREIMRVGEYLPLAPTRGMQDTALVADTLYAAPFYVPRALSLDRIAVQITAQAGENIRFGIYSNGTNLYPGALVLDSGEVTLSDTQVEAVTISESKLKGIYWGVILSDGTPSLRGLIRTFNPLGFSPTDWNSFGMAWVVSQTYGALPATFTAGGSVTRGGERGYCLFRLASLD